MGGDSNPLLINDPRFAPAGVLAPKSKADLAFTMHILSWLATSGTAAIVDPGPRFDELEATFRGRGLEHPFHCIVVVHVERAEPVISPAYDDGLTEPEVRERWRGHYADLESERVT